jgi:hypothetical protein
MINPESTGDDNKSRAVRALAIAAVKIAKSTARSNETTDVEGGSDVEK